MRNNFDLFSLKQRIFLVKHFYQELGNFTSVKSNYEDFYGRRRDIPSLSADILIEVIKLFEETGNISCISSNFPDTSPKQEIEIVCVKAEVHPEDIIDETDIKDELPDSDIEGQPITPPKPKSNRGRKRKTVQRDLHTPDFQDDSSDSRSSNAYQEPLKKDTKSDNDILSISSPRSSTVKEEVKEGETYEDEPMKIFNENFGVTNILGTCTFCNQKYLKSELARHMSTHGKKKRHRERKLICEFCGKFFANHSRMEQHQIIHSNDRCYKCDIEGCSKAFKWRNSYEKHKMRHTEEAVKEFKCDLCEKAFMYSYILRKHIIDVHEPPQAFKCKCCDKTFTRKETFANHMRTHDSGTTLSEAEKNSKGIKTCEVCGKGCLLIHFEKHMMSHRGERPLKCEICGKGFIWKCGLRRHVMAHKGLEPKANLPVCEVCGKKMSKYQSLQKHMKIHERPEMPFKCPITGCEKSYSNERFLKRHVDRHASKRHQCDYCEVDYKDSQQLKIHVKKIHLKEEAPFKCKQCDKDSWTLRVHRQHMKARHNIKIPFVRKKE